MEEKVPGGEMTEERIPGEKGKKLEDIRKEAEEKACPVQRALYFVEEFIAGPMCSKCYPCSLGTGEAKIRLRKIGGYADKAGDEDLHALKRIGLAMTDGSFCKKGKDTGRFIIEILTASEEEFRRHIAGFCPEKECTALVEYVINPALCTICGRCAEVCKPGAIIGEKKLPYLSGYIPFEIRQRRCTKCGECIRVCPEGAIEVIERREEELVGKE
jgi:ferredoxin